MSKFNDFLSKLNKGAQKDKESSDDEAASTANVKIFSGKDSWMTKPLTFHIDSEKAYAV